MSSTHIQEYTVHIEIDDETGHRVAELWLRDGVLHNDHGPARRTFDETDGTLETETWMQNGQGHRDGDLPFETHWDTNTGCLEWQTYMIEGKTHRDGDKPAMLFYETGTGKLVREEYYKHGKRHRDKGPAVIILDPDTQRPRDEVYYKNGLRLSVPPMKPGPS